VGEAERAAWGEYSAPKGDLIVTAPIVFGRLHLLPVVAEFLKAYPDINIRIVLADRVVNLLEDHVDLAVRIGELPDSGLIASRVGAIRRVVCGSPAYFAAHGTPKHPSELGTHASVTFEGLMSPDAWIFTTGEFHTSVAVNSRLVVNTAEAAIDALPWDSGSRACFHTRSRVRRGQARSPLSFKSTSRSPHPSISSIPMRGSCHSSCAPSSILRHHG
jgi:DNA-binding transcriptional LysR family regulator